MFAWHSIPSRGDDCEREDSPRRGTKRVTTAGRLIVPLPPTTLYASAKFLNVHAKRVKARREAEESGVREEEIERERERERVANGTKFTMQ